MQLPCWIQLAVQLIGQGLLLTQGVDSLVVLLAVPQAFPPAPHHVHMGSGSFVKCEACAAPQQLPALKVVKAAGLRQVGGPGSLSTRLSLLGLTVGLPRRSMCTSD